MNPDHLQRFGGIARLYGHSALQTFSQSHVMIVGLGGVGSWAAEALVRSGIGHLSLVDLDDLCLTNTNRQIHALSNTIGQPKTTALAQRLLLINPDLKLTTHQTFYTAKNSSELLDHHSLHAVLDAIDSVPHKCHLLATCHQRQIPVITSGGAGGRIDPAQIQLADLAHTHGDPLLQTVRRTLRADYGFPAHQGKKPPLFHLPAIFSPEKPRFPQPDGTCAATRPENLAKGLKCDSGFGAATHLTATFAHHTTAWILKTLSTKKSITPLPPEK